MESKTVTQKELNSIKLPDEGFMQISFGYSHKIIVPYSDGMKIIDGMRKAELVNESYDTDTYISPIKAGDSISFNPVGNETYRKIKIAKLMNIPLKELEIETG